MMHAQVWRLRGQRYDANVHATIFNALQDLVAEVTINADVDLRKSPLKFRKNIRQEIQAGRFVRAKKHRALHNVAAIGHNLDRLISQAQQAFSVIEEHFAGGRQLNGFRGTVEQLGAVGLFQLTNLRADSGLRAKNFLASTRETLQFGDVYESGKLVEVHI